MIRQWLMIIIPMVLSLVSSESSTLESNRINCNETRFTTGEFAILYDESEQSEVLDTIEHMEFVLFSGVGHDPFFTGELSNVDVYRYSDAPKSPICPSEVKCLEKDLVGAYIEALGNMDYSPLTGRAVILVTMKDVEPHLISRLKQIIEAARSSKEVAFFVFMLTYNGQQDAKRMLQVFDHQNVILVPSYKNLRDTTGKWKTQIWKTAYGRCIDFIKDKINISITMTDELIGYKQKTKFKCRTHFKTAPKGFELLRDGESVLPYISQYADFIVEGKEGEKHNITCVAHFAFGLIVTSKPQEFLFPAKKEKYIRTPTLIDPRGRN